MICARSSRSEDYGPMRLRELVTDKIHPTTLARICRLNPFGGFLSQFVQ